MKSGLIVLALTLTAGPAFAHGSRFDSKDWSVWPSRARVEAASQNRDRKVRQSAAIAELRLGGPVAKQKRQLWKTKYWRVAYHPTKPWRTPRHPVTPPVGSGGSGGGGAC